MKRTVTLGLMLSLVTQLSFAQGIMECGTPDTQPFEIPESQKNHCFTVSDIQSSCTKLWLRVNIHFFVQDNCTGSISPGGGQSIPIEDAYEIAENLINKSNIELEDNYEQWNQIPDWGLTVIKPAQCIPFRYALSGVYIHCNTSAMNTAGSNLAYFQNNFGINIDSEYNAYFVSHPSASGEANGIPGNSFTSEDITSTSIFNHEMGHVLRLRHSWISDDVDDTPPINFQYDYNCNGNLTDVFPLGVGAESKRRQCFFAGWEDPNPSIDYDGDGNIDYLDYCDIANPNCMQYPCCDWKYINNNIMVYSSYTQCCAAYTEGQITRILENLSTDTYCEYIVSITDDICRPPMANIHVLPNESVLEPIKN